MQKVKKYYMPPTFLDKETIRSPKFYAFYLF